MSGVVGTPYGGVERVPADQKWIWVVYGVGVAGEVLLEWWPSGSVFAFYEDVGVSVSVGSAVTYTDYAGGAWSSLSLSGVGALWAVVSGSSPSPVYVYRVSLPSARVDLSGYGSSGGVVEAYSGSVISGSGVRSALGEPRVYRLPSYSSSNLSLLYMPNGSLVSVAGVNITVSSTMHTVELGQQTQTSLVVYSDTILLPHTKALSLDGADDYLRSSSSPRYSLPPNATLASRVYVEGLPTAGGDGFIARYTRYVMGVSFAGTIGLWVHSGYAWVGNWLPQGAQTIELSRWYSVVGYWNATHLSLYLDGAPYGTAYSSQDPSVTVGYAGSGLVTVGEWDSFLDGMIGYALALAGGDGAAVAGELAGYNVSARSLSLFLDPTFYNGTHFVDPVTGAVLEPVGGPAVVEDTSRWVWRVYGWPGSGRLVLSWFPSPSVVVFRDSNGLPVYIVELSSTSAVVYNYSLGVVENTTSTVLANVSGTLYVEAGFVNITGGAYTVEVFLGRGLDEVPIDYPLSDWPVGTRMYIGFGDATGGDWVGVVLSPEGSYVGIVVDNTTIRKIPITAPSSDTIVVTYSIPRADQVRVSVWAPGGQAPVYAEATLDPNTVSQLSMLPPGVVLETMGGVILTVAVERVGVFLGTFLDAWAVGKIGYTIGDEMAASSHILYVNLNQEGTYIKLDPVAGVTTGVDPRYSSPLTLVGFEGYTASISYGAVTLENILVTGSEYPVVLPLGYTLMVVVDVAARKISLVTIQMPKPPIREAGPQPPPGVTVPVATAMDRGQQSYLNISSTEAQLILGAAMGAIIASIAISYGAGALPIAVAGISAFFAVLSLILGYMELFALSIVLFAVGVARWWSR